MGSSCNTFHCHSILSGVGCEKVCFANNNFAISLLHLRFLTMAFVFWNKEVQAFVVLQKIWGLLMISVLGPGTNYK